jgi:DNA-binding response OmpR family regulator
MRNVFSNTVRVHIQSLREKFEDDSTTPKYIETVIGTGYRFVQPEHESIESKTNKESANE